MQDIKARREKLLVDAADCSLISNLATDPTKREMFRQLAEQYNQMADELGDVIVAQETEGGLSNFSRTSPNATNRCRSGWRLRHLVVDHCRKSFSALLG